MNVAAIMSTPPSKLPAQREQKRSFARGLVFALLLAIALWALMAWLA
jgi:predicted tellurium resistance membrane protein TerC